MADGVYSITFRLHDSLPPDAIANLVAERRALERYNSAELRHAFELSLDRALDRAYGSAYLADDRVAAIVANGLAHFDGERYRMFAWCVMPTHVHVVIKANGGLFEILHSWKSYTAKEANRVLGREGVFWAREYFDRIVRNEEDLWTTVAYVVNNPVEAGLENWKWVGSAI
ncbi:MAG TPA: transposase [Thermoanaerobaculia bacterium]|nr:transposase [Thermoanaerobaculia bacterium]